MALTQSAAHLNGTEIDQQDLIFGMFDRAYPLVALIGDDEVGGGDTAQGHAHETIDVIEAVPRAH